MEKFKIITIIPSYNDLKSLKKVVKKNKKITPLLILDDNSSDDTLVWCKENKIDCLKNKFNFGYEKNLINGLKKVIKKYDYVITLDADGEHNPNEIKKIFKIIHNYDLIIFERERKNRFLEIFLDFIFKNLFQINDPLSGFKIYKSSIAIKALKNSRNDLFLVDLLLNFIFLNKKIKNYKINNNKREFGKSKVGSFLRVNLKLLKIIFFVIYKILVKNFSFYSR